MTNPTDLDLGALAAAWEATVGRQFTPDEVCQFLTAFPKLLATIRASGWYAQELEANFDDMVKQRDAAKARVAELEAALWPFAEFERQLAAMFNMLGGPEDMEPDDGPRSEVITAANGKGAHFTLRREAFIRARAARDARQPAAGETE